MNKMGFKFYVPSCCLIISTLISITILLPTYLLFIEKSSYLKYNCTVIGIEYPVNLPDLDLNNWKSCDCGDDCSSYNPCIKIFTNQDQSFIKKNYENKNTECTFYNNVCEENINDFSVKLNQSNELYNQYINQTIDCYIDYDINNIFIENDPDKKTVTIIAILVLVVYFITIVTFIYNIC